MRLPAHVRRIKNKGVIQLGDYPINKKLRSSSTVGKAGKSLKKYKTYFTKTTLILLKSFNNSWQSILARDLIPTGGLN